MKRFLFLSLTLAVKAAYAGFFTDSNYYVGFGASLSSNKYSTDGSVAKNTTLHKTADIASNTITIESKEKAIKLISQAIIDSDYKQDYPIKITLDVLYTPADTLAGTEASLVLANEVTASDIYLQVGKEYSEMLKEMAILAIPKTKNDINIEWGQNTLTLNNNQQIALGKLVLESNGIYLEGVTLDEDFFRIYPRQHENPSTVIVIALDDKQTLLYNLDLLEKVMNQAFDTLESEGIITILQPKKEYTIIKSKTSTATTVNINAGFLNKYKRFYYGAELGADLGSLKIGDEKKDGLSVKFNYNAYLTAKTGISVIPSTLAYIFGGVGISDYTFKTTINKTTKIAHHYILGAGTEFAINDKVNIYSELSTNVSGKSINLTTGHKVDVSANKITVGIKYYLNSNPLSN